MDYPVSIGSTAHALSLFFHIFIFFAYFSCLLVKGRDFMFECRLWNTLANKRILNGLNEDDRNEVNMITSTLYFSREDFARVDGYTLDLLGLCYSLYYVDDFEWDFK